MCVLRIVTIILSILVATGDAIRCYQCGSNTDSAQGWDNCGLYIFNSEKTIAVECNSAYPHMSGFCVKVVQQSPKGFTWDGRWRQVIRRCGTVTDIGVGDVCNWGVYDNGVYWEECFCSEDCCNAATSRSTSIALTAGILTLIIYRIL